MANSTSKTESLTGFEFDDKEKFFGIESNTLGLEKVMKQTKAARAGEDLEDDDEDDGTPTNLDDEKDKEKGTKNVKKKVKEEEEEDPDFDDFEETKSTKEKEVKKVSKKEEIKNDEEEEDKKDDDEEETKEEDEDIFTVLATDLKSKGIFSNVKIAKDAKLTEDQFFDHFEEELEARLDEALEDLVKDMDDEGKAFLKFKRNGGNSHTFITHYGNSLNLKEFDEEKPEHINKVLNHYLRTYEKLEDEDFEDRLKYIKDGGKEKITAARYYKIIKKDDDTRKEAIVQIQEKAKKKEEEGAKAFNEALKDTLDKVETIGAFTITKTEQKELAGYINKPTVKVGKNSYIPQLTADLNRILSAEKEKDMEELILLAKNIRNHFDVKDLVTTAKTKVATSAKSKLADAKNGNRRMATSGGYSRGRTLADLIE